MAEKYGHLSTGVTADKYMLILEKTRFSLHTTQGMQERKQSKCTNGNLLPTGRKQRVNLSVIDVIIIKLFNWEGIDGFCCANIFILRVFVFLESRMQSHSISPAASC